MAISDRASLTNIAELGVEFGLLADAMTLFGNTKAKIDLCVLQLNDSVMGIYLFVLPKHHCRSAMTLPKKGAKGLYRAHSSLNLNAGAGFITARVGNVMTMLGLEIKPGYLKIDIDADGEIIGLG